MSRAAIRGISEEDFGALADAANAALRNGDRKLAERLDCMARKANAALASTKHRGSLVPGMNAQSIGWKEVPSTIPGGAA